MRRVFFLKFVRWIDTASLDAIRRALLRACVAFGIVLAVFVPQFLLGFLGAIAGSRFALVGFALFAWLHWRSAVRFIRRRKFRGNQHTFHGVPVDELATYLIEQGKFTRDHAVGTLGLSQGRYQKITGDLKKYGVLVHGENNAHVLSPISREELVRQLRDNFPLRYDEHGKVWVERGGQFATYLLDREKEQEAKQEKEARLDKRIRRKQEQLSFASRPLALSL